MGQTNKFGYDIPSDSLVASGSAPNNATFITQTPSASLTAEQALSLLATGYMKVTTGTGVVSSQAVPIPVADGGTGAITAAAARTSFGILSGTDTLVAGTVTITAAITANSRIVATIKDAVPGAGNLTISLGVPVADRNVGAGTFVVRANLADGTINVLDTSTFDWIVIG